MKKLIVGAGKKTIKEEGDIFLDIRPFENIDVVHDLNKLPWPFEDSSVEGICAIHVVEHLNSLLDFMNECHRILKPGYSLYLETPRAGANNELEFADPTHVRCYTVYSFLNYFTPEGIDNFGYTEKGWNIFLCRPIPSQPDCLQIHAYPLKHE